MRRPSAVVPAAAVAFMLSIIPAARSARADDWPQWLGPQRDGVWRETGLLEKFPEGGPKVLWRTPCGAGYAGPAVAGGRVFLTDRLLDDGARTPDNPFARKDKLPGGGIPGRERVRCLDAKTGKVLWSHEYPVAYTMSYASGPRATPVVAGGKVWTLGAEGDVLCLSAEDGKVLWRKKLGKPDGESTPVWGFSAHPLLDGDRLICIGDAEGVAVALNKDTGETVWKSLTAPEPGYCPPMIYEFAGKRQLIIWHPRAVVGLDPADGKPLWKFDWNIQAGLSVPTPRKLGDKLFLTSFYNGSLMLRPGADSVEAVWKKGGPNEKKTEALHSIMPSPFLRDGHIYGVCSYGELRCLKADTGERVWETFAATSGKAGRVRWSNAFLVAQGETGDRFWLANEHGELILASLTPAGYTEIGRAKLLEPTNADAKMTDPKRLVVWSHPAFADRCVFLRNDKEIVCASLAAGQ
jgi:outer membrane protein assembly factor BamB